MVEKTERTGGETGPRSADGRRFEVFVRDEESDPVRHVGTVAAPTPDIAHEEASKLFAWYARDVWVCPSAEMHRYSAESLAETDSDGSVGLNGDGGSTVVDEPRVYEETEGTPTVACGSAPIDGETDRSDAPEDDVSDAPEDDVSDAPEDDVSDIGGGSR